MNKINIPMKIKQSIIDIIGEDNLMHPKVFKYLAANPNAINYIYENLNNYKLISTFKDYLSSNPDPDVIIILEQNPNLIEWEVLSKNPNAIDLLKKNVDKINWVNFAEIESKDAIDLIEDNIHYILNKLNNYEYDDEEDKEYNKEFTDFAYNLSNNKFSAPLLSKFPELIIWEDFCRNDNPEAINIFKNNIDKIVWNELSLNHNLIKILDEIKVFDWKDKVDWKCIAANDYVIPLIEQNLNKIDTNAKIHLLNNENALHLFENDLDSIYMNNNIYDISMSRSILAMNPNTINILHKYITKFELYHLISNPSENDIKYILIDNLLSDNALQVLPRYADSRVVWWQIMKCKNLKALDLIIKYKNLINWEYKIFNSYYKFNDPDDDQYEQILEYTNDNRTYFQNLLANPNIFSYDYTEMRVRKKHINEEIIKMYYHPNNLKRKIDELGDTFDLSDWTES